MSQQFWQSWNRFPLLLSLFAHWHDSGCPSSSSKLTLSKPDTIFLASSFMFFFHLLCSSPSCFLGRKERKQLINTEKKHNQWNSKHIKLTLWFTSPKVLLFCWMWRTHFPFSPRAITEIECTLMSRLHFRKAWNTCSGISHFNLSQIVFKI